MDKVRVVLALGGVGLRVDLGRGSGQQGLHLVVDPRGVLAQDDRGRAETTAVA
jgi:hypothetical protein